MTKLDELRKLAKDVENHVIDDSWKERAMWQIKHARFMSKLDTQTILAMCDLLEQMREALGAMQNYARLDNKGLKITDDTIAAFDKWNNEQKG